MSRLTVIASSLLFLAACGERGPEAVAREFVVALESYTAMPAPNRLEAAFELLDRASREDLEREGRAATAALGSPIPPWALLRYDGFVEGQRLVRVEQLETGAERAQVAVVTAWAVPPELGGPAEAPRAHALSLVREDGVWRVGLRSPPPEYAP